MEIIFNMVLLLALLVCYVTPTLIQACGRKPFGSRIVGGEQAPKNSWPWQLSLRYNGGHICGASLLNQYWALSAAHCVQQSSDPKRYSLVLGAHGRTNDGEVYGVTRVIKHPRFSMQHLRHDVAVLKLERAANLDNKVGTVCLPPHGSRVSQGTTCYVTGWGRINPSNNQLSTHLKQASAPVASHSQCRQKNGGTVDESSMVCVGGQGSSVCNGDSGGPLSCMENGKWVVRGAASWVTSRSCPGHTYSVYARISSYVNWINGYVQSGGGGEGGDCTDNNNRCSYWKSRGYCQHSFVDYMKKNCRKTCNFCGGGGGGGGGGSSCLDKNSACPEWTKKGYCKGKYEAYMKKNCKKSCNVCGAGGWGGRGGGGGGEGGDGGLGKCGYKPSARIVGGTEAPKGAWPWQAQVRTRSGFTFCGGTLVHPQWVVTAAHCVSGKSSSSVRVRMGAHYRSSIIGIEQDFEVVRIIPHESYKKPRGLAHDIAMLKLHKPAQINSKVGMACLPTQSENVEEIDGRHCWVTGFGTLSSGGSLAKVLMQVSVPIVSEARCKRAYGSSIHTSMVCAGLDKGGKDSCQGDSGGPMVCEQNGKFFLEGVVSWGSGCASAGKYGVYARVRYLRKWVDDQINRY